MRVTHPPHPLFDQVFQVVGVRREGGQTCCDVLLADGSRLRLPAHWTEQRRAGFEHLLAAVAVGEVGIIFSLEVSRISRGNRNWYQLLDSCAITHTLIADGEGLYDPGTYNDRLLLGLKGTMSEAELHLMKQRLVEAVRAKAQRGEFRQRLPAGYDWDEAGRLQKTPDEQVRSSIAAVFARFDELGSIHRVHCALVEQGLQVAVRAGRGTALRWAMRIEEPDANPQFRPLAGWLDRRAAGARHRSCSAGVPPCYRREL